MSPTREVSECSREGLRRCLLTTSCLNDAVSPVWLGYRMFALAPLAQQVPAYLWYCLDFMHTQYILAAPCPSSSDDCCVLIPSASSSSFSHLPSFGDETLALA